MPRGPRRYLRPVAESMSQPIASHVHRQLADGLAGVEQERHAGLPRDRADRGRRVHEAAVGRDMGHGDQLHALVEHRPNAPTRELAVLVVGHRLDRRAGARGDLQEGDELLAYSARAVRMRSPGPNGSE